MKALRFQLSQEAEGNDGVVHDVVFVDTPSFHTEVDGLDADDILRKWFKE